jgi:hypothetical protein
VRSRSPHEWSSAVRIVAAGLVYGVDPQTLVSSRREIVLKLDWYRASPFTREWCAAGLMFHPEADSEYLVVYLTPAQGGNQCGVALVELVDGPKGQETQKVDDLVPLKIKMGLSGAYSERLCRERF